MAYYLSLSAGTFAIIKSVADSYRTTMEEIGRRNFLDALAIRGPRDAASRRFGDAVFTGKIYFYYEMEMEPRQIADLLDLYRSRGLSLELRGPRWGGH